MRDLVEILDALTGYLDMTAGAGFFTEDESNDIDTLENELYMQIKDMEVIDED